jgi:LacI family transcriptional regulator
VRSLAEKMGYHVNTLARGLASGKTNFIGVCGAGVLQPFMHRLLSQLASYADRKGQKLIFAPWPLEEGLQVLLSLGIDGLLICWETLSADLAAELRERQLPTVVLGAHSKYCSSFNVDRIGGVKAGISKLISLGHRRIAFVGENAASDKWQGFVEAHREAGLEVSEAVMVPCQGSTLGGYRAKDLFLAAECSAAFATSDEIALGLLKSLEEDGRRIPADYSILGYDGIYLDQLGRPRLATLAQPSSALASKAIEQLFAAPSQVVHQSILPEFIAGDSIGMRG